MSGANVDAIVQARLGSSRLPRKVLSLLCGRPLLAHVFDRLKSTQFVRRVILATTAESEDDALAEFCEEQGVLCFRGDRENVLARFIGAAEAFGCERIARVCSDNPFIDVNALEEMIAEFNSDLSIDYCCHTTFDGVPIILKPIGLFAEGVTLRALKRAAQMAMEQKHFEHVTMFIYQRPELFKIKFLPLEKDLDVELRFTIDYPEDVMHCEEIMRHLRGRSRMDLMEVLYKYPQLRREIAAFSQSHQKRY
jgi:spore coat polysaccharide biosynthesis protein SpsF